MSTDVLSGRPESVVVLPGSSWLPLMAAVATGAFFVGVLLKWYPVALLALGLTAMSFLAWAWHTGARVDSALVPARDEVRLPLHFEHVAGAPGWHGLFYTLIADAAILGSLAFGAVYLWALAPGWPPPVVATVPAWCLGAAVLCWGLNLVAARMQGRWLRREAIRAETADGAPRAGKDAEPRAGNMGDASWKAKGGEAAPTGRAPMTALMLQAAGAMAWLAVLGWLLGTLPPAATHAQPAVAAALLWYAAIHAGIASLLVAFLLLRWQWGFVSARRSLEPAVVARFSHYAMGSGVFCLALAALPGLAG